HEVLRPVTFQRSNHVQHKRRTYQLESGVIQGIEWRWSIITVKPQVNVAIAIPKRRPWSPIIEYPNQVRWLRMAASIAPVVRMPPIHLSRGINRQTEAKSSQMPWPHLHQGSVPIFRNM